MNAMVLTAIAPVTEGSQPLTATDLPEPTPGPGELLVQVTRCGVCHTELDEIEGRTPPSSLPRVLGHQVVGRVVDIGRTESPRVRKSESPIVAQSEISRVRKSESPTVAQSESPRDRKSESPTVAERSDPRALGLSDSRTLGLSDVKLSVGDRVGVAWIYSACGVCRYCTQGLENLCPYFRATGRDADGGYAQYMVVPAGFAYRIPDAFTDSEAAPLLCAGAIGYRSMALTGLRAGDSLGLTGFGASAHLVLKMVRYRFPSSRVFVFTRSPEEREFARHLGAEWAGDIVERAPELLSAIIDTTPAWKPVVEALANLLPGGRLVVNSIRKEDGDKDVLTRLDYPAHLWMEKQVVSVANVTRRDVREFLDLAAQIGMKPQVEEYPLAEANRALADIRQRRIKGGKVLVVQP